MPLPNLLGGLMDHDPLCPLIVDGVEGPLHLYECPCDLIAKVRQDMLAKCIAAVEELLGPDDEQLRWLMDDAVLATLRGLEDQP